jgi:hypothetical protein
MATVHACSLRQSPNNLRGSALLHGVNTQRVHGSLPVWLLALAPILSGAIPEGRTLAVLAIALVYRLAAEWQRRTTLVSLVMAAPPGTIIHQGKGSHGPAMSISVGFGGVQPESPRSTYQ